MDVLGFEERGIQRLWAERHWIPAFAGMTNKSFQRLIILKFGALTLTLPSMQGRERIPARFKMRA